MENSEQCNGKPHKSCIKFNVNQKSLYFFVISLLIQFLHEQGITGPHRSPFALIVLLPILQHQHRAQVFFFRYTWGQRVHLLYTYAGIRHRHFSDSDLWHLVEDSAGRDPFYKPQRRL